MLNQPVDISTNAILCEQKTNKKNTPTKINTINVHAKFALE